MTSSSFGKGPPRAGMSGAGRPATSLVGSIRQFLHPPQPAKAAPPPPPEQSAPGRPLPPAQTRRSAACGRAIAPAVSNVGLGRCRSRFVAALFGVAAAAVFYLGHFHAGLVADIGVQNIHRVDLVPDYIRWCMATDVQSATTSARRRR